MKRRGKRATGEGSVFWNEKKGRWDAVGPRPLRLVRSGKTQAEAIRRRDEALAKLGYVSKASARQKVSVYLANWLASLTGSIRDKTWDSYESIVRLHISPVIGDLLLGAVSPADIQQVLTVAAQKGKSASLRNQIRCHLFTAFERARRLDVIPKNPADVELIAAPRPTKLIEPLPDKEIRTLLTAIASDRLHALWLGYLACGARRGDLLALDREQDLRFEKRGRKTVAVITIRRSLQRVRGALVFLPPKTPHGYRTIELPHFMTAPLRAHLAAQEKEREKAGALWEETGLLFCTHTGRPLDPQNVLHKFQKLLPTKRRIHAIRHTVISMLLRDGVDIKTVQAVAGHSRASITHDTYGHLLPGTTGRAAAAMDAAFKKLR